MGIVDPNELSSSFSTVLHALWSGIVFAVLFVISMFFHHSCPKLFDSQDMCTH